MTFREQVLDHLRTFFACRKLYPDPLRHGLPEIDLTISFGELHWKMVVSVNETGSHVRFDTILLDQFVESDLKKLIEFCLRANYGLSCAHVNLDHDRRRVMLSTGVPTSRNPTDLTTLMNRAFSCHVALLPKVHTALQMVRSGHAPPAEAILILKEQPTAEHTKSSRVQAGAPTDGVQRQADAAYDLVHSALCVADGLWHPVVVASPSPVIPVEAGVIRRDELEVNFEDERCVLGAGSMGPVWKAKFRGLEVAVRYLVPRPRTPADLAAQLAVLRSVAHPHVRQLIGTCFIGMDCLLVTELLVTNVDRLLHHDRPLRDLSATLRQRMAWELALALAYLHGEDVVHTRLRPSNILLTEELHVKLSDYRPVRGGPDAAERAIGGANAPDLAPEGSTVYDAPEVKAGRPHTRASDVFSFGACVYEIATGRAYQPGTKVNVEEHDLGRVVAACLEVDPPLRPVMFPDVVAQLERLRLT